MLVKVGTVKKAEPVRIPRKMRRRPIQKDADSFAMAAIHKVHKIRRRAVAACHRVIADRLIAPRTIKRMLHDGHQLDVRVAQPLHVRNQFFRQLAISEPAVSVRSFPPPRSRVQLVHGQRRMQPVSPRARFHPRRVFPFVVFDVADYRRVFWPQLRSESIRVGFQPHKISVARTYLEFIQRAFAKTWNENLPNAAHATVSHGVNAPVPKIEITHDTHALRVRRPHSEMHATHSVDFPHMSALLFVLQVVRAFA